MTLRRQAAAGTPAGPAEADTPRALDESSTFTAGYLTDVQEFSSSEQFTLTEDFQYEISFGANSAPGSTIFIDEAPGQDTPEPATLLTLGMGLVTLAWKAKRKAANW